jgi:hypothetical protein
MTSHDDQVKRQFGPVTAAYLKSSVHAEGPDLAFLGRKLTGESILSVLIARGISNRCVHDLEAAS